MLPYTGNFVYEAQSLQTLQKAWGLVKIACE